MHIFVVLLVENQSGWGNVYWF